MDALTEGIGLNLFPSCGSIVRNSAGVPNNPADITLQHKGTSNLSPAKESKTRAGGERKVRIQKYFLQDILQLPQSSSGNQRTRRTMSAFTILFMELGLFSKHHICFIFEYY